MNPIVHFELPADDTKRAQAFYSSIFGWRFEEYPGMEGYLGVVTKEKGADGINGGMMKRQSPGTPVTNYISVPDIDVVIEKVKAAGGKIIMEKDAIPGNMGWIAVFVDTEGNTMGLHQEPAR